MSDPKPFPNPVEDPEFKPSTEDSFEDFEREGAEKEGTQPPPRKTFAFWASLVSTILAFVLYSEVLPPDSPIMKVVVFVLFLAGHFGYAGVHRALAKKRPEMEADGVPEYQKKSFWGSLSATIAAFALGAGLEDQGAQAAGMAAVILSYLGFRTKPWVKRKEMVSPHESDRVAQGALGAIQGLAGGKKEESPDKK